MTQTASSGPWVCEEYLQDTTELKSGQGRGRCHTAIISQQQYITKNATAVP